jgi:hypothetical protein
MRDVSFILVCVLVNWNGVQRTASELYTAEVLTRTVLFPKNAETFSCGIHLHIYGLLMPFTRINAKCNVFFLYIVIYVFCFYPSVYWFSSSRKFPCIPLLVP